ncbi:MAG: NAD(P)/FAD-dependent oxidoreductase [Acidobacteria bacterium]|nr:NAD(P)/FAD-dependent oxidoreductase [Acidobacteriota bacterium]
MFDIIVIGGGPAGISCAKEAERLGLKVAIIEKSHLGGSVRYARKIENFPPFLSVSGIELSNSFEDFISKSRIKILMDEVLEISLCGSLLLLKTKKLKTIKSKSVFVATGQIDMIPKEYICFEDLIMKSKDIVSMDCDGKEIIVYGGGDVAFDNSMSLSDRNAKVTIVCKSIVKAKPILKKEAKEKGIKVIENCIITDIKKFNFRKSVAVKKGSRKIKKICDAVVFATGKAPLLPEFNLPIKIGRLDNNNLEKLSKYGIFLGGDVIRGKNRNVAVAVGDGITAAFCANNFLKGEKR